jgi:hypothetical protein
MEKCKVGLPNLSTSSEQRLEPRTYKTASQCAAIWPRRLPIKNGNDAHKCPQNKIISTYIDYQDTTEHKIQLVVLADRLQGRSILQARPDKRTNTVNV